MTTADYIPFINTIYDCQAAARFYSDAFAMRVGTEQIEKTRNILPAGPKRWIDGSIDGLHHRDPSKLTEDYQKHLRRFAEYQTIADPQFQKKPEKPTVHSFVFSVLDFCKQQAPDWLSVPQLPHVNDTGRNKINRLLAETANQWRAKSAFSGRLILPAIFTHQNQINKKTERNKKVMLISQCLSAAGADGLWVADSTLNDQEGSGKFDERFPALRNLHDELNHALPGISTTICGPYWGMNLILWARGCARYPGIGLGGTYRYNIPGRKPNKKRNERIALRPLRRWAIATPLLRNWLAQTIASLDLSDPARTEFVQIENEFSMYLKQSSGKLQTAEFYKSWFDKFSSLPPAGRALALYHDLSSAYVLGKTLKTLPDEREGTARRPERVAQQLMMNCL